MMSRVLLLLVCAVVASNAFDSSITMPVIAGGGEAYEMVVAPGASLIWNHTDAEIGKTTDICENGGRGKIVVGTSYAGARINIIDLFSGAIEGHAAPGDHLETYSVETAANGQLIALGCPLSGTGCKVFSWSSLNVTSAVTWEKTLTGNLFHTQHAIKLSDDAKVVAVAVLNERPHKHIPMPGKLQWFHANDGSSIGEVALARTLGEVFLDADTGTNVATRQFHTEFDGDFQVYATATGKQLLSIPDRFSRFAVSPKLDLVAIPQIHHEPSFDLHSATTGAVAWSYTPPVGEYNNGLVIGRNAVVGTWFKQTSPAFTFRVFNLTQSTKTGVPRSTFSINLPHTAEAFGTHFEVSDDDKTSDLAFAVPGVGVHYVSLTAATQTPILILSWPDPCGFHGIKMVRTANKGAVVLAALNKMINGQCSFSHNLVALTPPM